MKNVSSIYMRSIVSLGLSLKSIDKCLLICESLDERCELLILRSHVEVDIIILQNTLKKINNVHIQVKTSGD